MARNVEGREKKKKENKNEKKTKTKTKTKNGEGGAKNNWNFRRAKARGFDFAARGKKGENNERRGIYFGKAKPSFIRADA